MRVALLSCPSAAEAIAERLRALEQSLAAAG